MVCLNTQTKAKEYRVVITTPYLSEGLEQFSGPMDAMEAIALYGYEPNNLKGTRSLETKDKKLVMIWSPEYDGTLRYDVRAEEIQGANLVIAGSTESGEDEVLNYKGSGLIVARFSIFYGERSGYTNRTPEAGGYSLDIPKSVSTVRSLLTNDRVLEALVSRNETNIRKSLDELNSELRDPILVTPYLTKALEVRR